MGWPLGAGGNEAWDDEAGPRVPAGASEGVTGAPHAIASNSVTATATLSLSIRSWSRCGRLLG